MGLRASGNMGHLITLSLGSVSGEFPGRGSGNCPDTVEQRPDEGFKPPNQRAPTAMGVGVLGSPSARRRVGESKALRASRRASVEGLSPAAGHSSSQLWHTIGPGILHAGPLPNTHLPTTEGR